MPVNDYTYVHMIYIYNLQVVLAVGYRVYQGVNDAMKRPTKMCWRVNRGQGLSPVQSCEGN